MSRRVLPLFLLAGAVALASMPTAMAQPANDDFGAQPPQMATPSSGTAHDSTVGATSQPGEPLHAGTGSNSIWNSATNSSGQDLQVEVTMTQADFDTVIAAYTGSSVDALTEITSNDDAIPGDPTSGSAISFPFPDGATVHIAYAGYQGQTGSFSLTVHITAASSGPPPSGAAPSTRFAPAAGTGQPVEAALGVSARAVGDGGADALVLGRSDNFADNLGGAVLARVAGGPLLLTPRDTLDPRVDAEIRRVLGPAPVNCQNLHGGNEAQIYLLGGTAALAEDVEIALIRAGYCTKRVSGPSRYETSVAVATQVETILLNNGGGTTYPYLIARADNPVDSATGGAYGGRTNTPILVTNSDSLHPAIEQYLSTGTSGVTLLGGTSALDQSVEERIRQIVSPQGAAVDRLAGASRDDTARVIAQSYAAAVLTADGSPIDTAGIVNGFRDDTWAFALTLGPVTDGPVLYVQTDDVLGTTTSFLQGVAPLGSGIIAVGNSGLISDTTLADAARAAG